MRSGFLNGTVYGVPSDRFVVKTLSETPAWRRSPNVSGPADGSLPASRSSWSASHDESPGSGAFGSSAPEHTPKSFDTIPARERLAVSTAAISRPPRADAASHVTPSRTVATSSTVGSTRHAAMMPATNPIAPTRKPSTTGQGLAFATIGTTSRARRPVPTPPWKAFSTAIETRVASEGWNNDDRRDSPVPGTRAPISSGSAASFANPAFGTLRPTSAAAAAAAAIAPAELPPTFLSWNRCAISQTASG